MKMCPILFYFLFILPLVWKLFCSIVIAVCWIVSTHTHLQKETRGNCYFRNRCNWKWWPEIFKHFERNEISTFPTHQLKSDRYVEWHIILSILFTYTATHTQADIAKCRQPKRNEKKFVTKIKKKTAYFFLISVLHWPRLASITLHPIVCINLPYSFHSLCGQFIRIAMVENYYAIARAATITHCPFAFLPVSPASCTMRYRENYFLW